MLIATVLVILVFGKLVLKNNSKSLKFVEKQSFINFESSPFCSKIFVRFLIIRFLSLNLLSLWLIPLWLSTVYGSLQRRVNDECEEQWVDEKMIWKNDLDVQQWCWWVNIVGIYYIIKWWNLKIVFHSHTN